MSPSEFLDRAGLAKHPGAVGVSGLTGVRIVQRLESSQVWNRQAYSFWMSEAIIVVEAGLNPTTNTPYGGGLSPSANIYVRNGH